MRGCKWNKWKEDPQLRELRRFYDKHRRCLKEGKWSHRVDEEKKLFWVVCEKCDKEI